MAPNAVSFNSAINDAWSKSGKKGAVMRAEDLLDMMHTLAEHTPENDALRPSSISFNSDLKGWAKSGEKIAPFRSEVILEMTQELYGLDLVSVKPNAQSYTTVIDWLLGKPRRARCSGKSGSGERYCWILRHLVIQ